MELPLADVSAALFAVIGVLALLNNRHTSDVGGYADISMMDAFLSLTTPFFSQALSQNNIQALTDDPAYGVFRCLDDESITFSIAGEDHFWSELCGVVGLGNLATVLYQARAENYEEIKSKIENAMVLRSSQEWAARLEVTGIPWAPVRTFSEMVNDPHLNARNLVQKKPGSTQQFLVQPVKFDGSTQPTIQGVPRLDYTKSAREIW